MAREKKDKVLEVKEDPLRESPAEVPAVPDEQAAAKEAAKFDKDASFEPTNLMDDLTRVEDAMKATEATLAKSLQTGRRAEALNTALGKVEGLSLKMKTVTIAISKMRESMLEKDLSPKDLQRRNEHLERVMEHADDLKRVQKEFQQALVLYEENPEKLKEETGRIVYNMEFHMNNIIRDSDIDSDLPRRRPYEVPMRRIGQIKEEMETRQAARKHKT